MCTVSAIYAHALSPQQHKHVLDCPSHLISGLSFPFVSHRVLWQAARNVLYMQLHMDTAWLGEL